METILGRHWHHLPLQEVAGILETSPEDGLDIFELERRQKRFGPNRLPDSKPQPALVRFLLHFHQPLVYILLSACAITAALQEWVDAGVILGVVLVNALVGFLQESNAVNAILALAKTLDIQATVVRAGKKQRVPATSLVPGDLVLLQSGDRVPADLRLVQCRDLQVDESSLTGESLPVAKRIEELPPRTPLADRANMAYASTLVTYGVARAVVVATSEATEIGRISALIASSEALATPLTRRIADFSRLLLYVIIGLAGATFAVGVLRGETWLNMLMASVALAVGAIPEGLPAAMTITLAIGVRRMARRHAIIRKLPAVETLGSTTVICSDKTGTLTQNQMTVRRILAAGAEHRVSGVGYAPSGSIDPFDPARDRGLLECLRSGVLCNDSALKEIGSGWRVEGDPTEGALLTAAAKAGILQGDIESALPRLDAIPFESQHQYMATLHEGGVGEPRLAYLKGSIESLLPRCVNALDASGGEAPFLLADTQRLAHAWAESGMRVMAFARAELPPEIDGLAHADVSAGLTFLGLQGMLDPPRPEAVPAVEACQSAGIRVKMITGDHGATAGAIAQAIGLGGAAERALSGASLAGFSDGELVDVAEAASVFARVSPEQKLRLVQALQARGHVVAMTGDGVNDAPALRRADIGVAMGLEGTEVAKEAADMILTDDNFASIEAAVEEGRGVFDNLTKFILWTLPTNVGEGLVILAAVLTGAVLPILPVQILWINMTTAVLLGLMLAFEPKEAGIMRRPPRDPEAPILTRPLLQRIGFVGILLLAGSFGLFEWALSSGASESEARTVAVNVFVIGELFYLFNCRSLTRSMFSLGVFSNRWLLLGVGTMLLLQLGLTYLPPMNVVFHTAPIGGEEWAAVAGVGLVIYVSVGLEKKLRRAFDRGAET